MDYSLQTHSLCAVAALTAGVINSIAGGGTILTFPALMTTLSPVAANATSATALLPGSLAGAFGFRPELRQVRRQLLWLIPPSLLGGWIGSELVVRFPAEFSRLFPWLILGATLLFLLQRPIQRLLGEAVGPITWRRQILIVLAQLLIAIYGGYFGAGIGILMIATLGFMGFPSIHHVNAAKTVLSSTINAITVANFIWNRAIVWELALSMSFAAIIGGYFGARLARKLRKETVRLVVILIGLLVTVYFFIRQAS